MPQQGPRVVSSGQLREMLEMPKENKEDRAFGWPAGTVRAVLAISLVIGLVAGVVVGLWLDGGSGAAQGGGTIAGPAGAAMAHYFTGRSSTNR